LGIDIAKEMLGTMKHGGRPETADVVRAAMKAAKESGSPLNAFQIVSLP